MHTLKRVLAPLAACLAAGGHEAAAADSTRLRLKIDSQGLSPALMALYHATHGRLEFKFPSDEAWLRARTKAIDGTYESPEAALKDMLECSGYGYRWLDFDTYKVSIVPAGEATVVKECIRIQADKAPEDGPVPYIVLDQRHMESRPERTLTEVLRQIPVGNGTFGASTVPGVPAPNPRAMGATRILVDGREVPGTYFNGAALPAISALPMSAVERVEIYPETYLDAYGGSSGGKTVNFILSHSCDAPSLRVDLGNSFASGSGVRRVFGSACKIFGDTQLQFRADVSNQEMLRVGERDFVPRARSAIIANEPSYPFTTSTPILGAGFNIKFLDASGPESITTLSREQIVMQDLGAAAANAGTQNIALANSAQSDGGARASLVDGQKDYYANLRVRQSLSESLSASFDAVVSQVMTRTSTSAADSAGLHSVFVAANAPGNFFHRDLIVAIPVEGLDFDLARQLTAHRLSAMLTYQSRWTRASIEVVDSKAVFSWHQPTATAAASAIASGETNVFDIDRFQLQKWVENYFSPSQVSDSWRIRAEVSRTFSLTEHTDLTLNGHVDRGQDAFRGGKELMQGLGDPEPDTVATLAPQSQSVNSAWLEANYSFTPQLRGLHTLDVRIAGRADRYRKTTNDQRCVPMCAEDAVPAHTDYHSINPSINLKYEPTDWLQLRGSASKGVRIPFSDEIGGTLTRPVPATTFRGLPGVGSSGQVMVIAGGNPDVDPERLQSWSAGLLFKPLAELSVSLDYTDVKKRNEIVSLSDLAIADFAALASTYPDAIRPLDPSQNPFGASVALDLRARNISRAESRAVEATIRFRKGSLFGFDMEVLTQVHSQILLRRQASPTSPWDDDTALTAYSPSRRAASNTVSFERGPLTIAFQSEYLGPYKLSPSLPDFKSQGARDIPSRFYQDVLMSYELGATPGSKLATEVQIGITNVFNRSPRRDVAERNLISPQDDPRLRAFLLSATVHF